MRAVLAAVIASLALVAGGCGGTEAAAGGDAAALLKPGALAYWETVSDPDSDQWKQVEGLLRRFPDGEKWIRMLREEFEQDAEITWPEVRAALGDRTAVAVYVESAEADPVVVGLTDPDDPEETVRVVRELNEAEPDDPVVTRVVDDWVVLSDTQAHIDEALAPDGERALGDEERFTSALTELPEDALSRVYVDVARVVERFAPQLEGDERDMLESLGLEDIDFAGAWARAEEEGASLAGIASGSGAERLLGTNEPFTSKLLERVPDDAFAFVTFRGESATEQLEQLKGNPLYRMGAREVEEFLGVTLDELVGIFDGEIAFYARRAAPIPELTLLLDPANPETARASADRVLRSVATRLNGEVTEDGDVTTARFGGFNVNLAGVDGLVVLTTSKGGIGDLEESGGKLPDSDAFKSALEQAEAPDSYTGLAWVDLREAIALALDFADSTDESIPSEVRRNLEPLRSFLAFGTAEGDAAEVRAFLGID